MKTRFVLFLALATSVAANACGPAGPGGPAYTGPTPQPTQVSALPGGAPGATAAPLMTATPAATEKPVVALKPKPTPEATAKAIPAATRPPATVEPAPKATAQVTSRAAAKPLAGAELVTEVFVRNLEVPWAIAFDPRGRLFISERPGRIRVKTGNTLQAEPVIVLPVASVSESGLHGIALGPDFEQSHHIYAYFTYRNESGGLTNKVVRFVERDGKGGDPVTILDGIPGERIHDGGRLRFGPDGKLYITTGDAALGSNSQDLKSLAGKILRLNPDGSIPADNPFPGLPVFSFGHRNPQGIDWHPTTGVPFAAEHGQAAQDEVNIIRPGGNFGWPVVRGEETGESFIPPLIQTGATTWAPAGISFYRGDLLSAFQGNLFVATLRGTHLRRVVLKGPDFRQVEQTEALFSGTFGRLRDVVEGPDGALYITTSNRDGRGAPTADDDRVIRISVKNP